MCNFCRERSLKGTKNYCSPPEQTGKSGERKKFSILHEKRTIIGELTTTQSQQNKAITKTN